MSVGAGLRKATDRTVRADNDNAPAYLAAGHDLTVEAGHDVTFTATEASAEHDLHLKAGHDVNLLAAYDQSTRISQHDRLFAGISGTLSSPLIGGANSLASAAQGLGGRDGQYSIAPAALAAYRTVQALGKAEDAYKAWQNKGGDLKDLPAAIGSASLTAGFEHSSSRTLQQGSTPVSTTLHSGAATTIEAEQGSIHGVCVQITAGPAPKGAARGGKDGNETIGGDPAAASSAAGSGGDPGAGTISLRAGRDIFLESAQATVDTLFGSQSSKLGVGVDLNGGFAAEGAYGRDSGQSHEVHQVDSHVLASGTVSLTSGGDMASAALTLAIANSPLADTYFATLKTHLGPLSVLHWINDALIAVCFMLVGLEIKGEVLDGRLRTWPDRVLPWPCRARRNDRAGDRLRRGELELPPTRCGGGLSRPPPTSPSRWAS